MKRSLAVISVLLLSMLSGATQGESAEQGGCTANSMAWPVTRPICRFVATGPTSYVAMSSDWLIRASLDGGKTWLYGASDERYSYNGGYSYYGCSWGPAPTNGFTRLTGTIPTKAGDIVEVRIGDRCWGVVRAEEAS